MAIGNLSNFTVPLPGQTTGEGTLMPKLKFRFRITFERFGLGSGTTEMTKQVQEAARPSVKFANQVIEIYNSKINYAGKPAWDPITVKLRDDVTGSVSKLVAEQNQKQFDFLEQSSAAAAGDYKFTMRIEMLDGGNGANTPNVLESWLCEGCYIESTNWTDLKYSEQSPAMIEIAVRFDNATQLQATDKPTHTAILGA